VDATEAIAASGALSGTLAAIEAGVFSPDERERYHGLVHALRHHDHFLVCADFDAYFAAQRETDALWRDPAAWWRSSILNTAGMAWFSSDRAIRDYARELWNVPSWPEA
jgi:starch phosphorylase